MVVRFSGRCETPATGFFNADVFIPFCVFCARWHIDICFVWCLLSPLHRCAFKASYVAVIILQYIEYRSVG